MYMIFTDLGSGGICLKGDFVKADEMPETQMIDPSIWRPLIGIIGLTQRDGAVELGYALAKAYQGKKYIAEAREAVIKYVKDTLGYDKVIEITNRTN